MKKLINKEQQEEIEALIRKFERNTKSELAIIIANSSDPYPAASLRFGIMATIICSVVSLMFFEVTDQALIPAIMFMGIFFFTLVGQFSFFKKFTLSKIEMRREVKEKALELFLSQLITKASHQNFSLLYISRQERIIEFIVGKEIKEHIDQADIDTFVDTISKNFKSQQYFEGIKLSMSNWQELMREKFPADEDTEFHNDIENKIIWI